MKTRTLTSLFYVLACAAALAQGGLTPPGPPAPTMKTLAQIEPRFPVSVIPTNLTQPGSYYLTGNLTTLLPEDGIRISTNDVTLDLMGFTLRGNSGAYSGIFVAGNRTNIHVRNGTIRSWGFHGVEAESTYGGLFEDLRVSNNSFDGFRVTGRSIIQNCLASANLRHGFNLDLTLIRGCLATHNDGDGIQVFREATVINNRSSNNGGAGLRVTGIRGVVEGNSVLGNIAVESASSVIVRNSAFSYSILTNNAAGPVLVLNAPLTNNNPHANYQF